MPKVAMIAKLTAADGKRDELAAVLEKIFPAVEQEAGTEAYVLHEDLGRCQRAVVLRAVPRQRRPAGRTARATP